MNVKNLMKLIDFIPSIPVDALNMGIYNENDIIEHTCGSIGCIIGHGVAILTKEEFDTYIKESILIEKIDYGGYVIDRNAPLNEILNVSAFYQYWSTKHFGLNDDQWNYLFAGYHDNDKDQAIQRINNLIDWDGKLPLEPGETVRMLSSL